MHKPVLLKEVIEYLNLSSGKNVIDATLSSGGHAEGILESYPDVKILGIEWDPDIFQEFQKKDLAKRIIAVNDSYVNLKNIAEENGFKPDGIIFDLGVSSLHYEASGRGFSFLRDEPLDMRFNPKTNNITAADIVNTATREEITDILANYGEEKFAPDIAKNITAIRKSRLIIGTLDLVGVINSSVPTWYRKRKIHPATKTFQALRIAVNKEMDNVANGVNAGIDILQPGGRMIVISFQGLEDKIVKEIFKAKAKEGIIKWVVKGTIKPEWEEVRSNPRARSAKMKIIEKI